MVENNPKHLGIRTRDISQLYSTNMTLHLCNVYTVYSILFNLFISEDAKEILFNRRKYTNK